MRQKLVAVVDVLPAIGDVNWCRLAEEQDSPPTQGAEKSD